MQLAIKSSLAKRSLMLAEALVFLAVLGWIVKYGVADVLARQGNRKNLELAVKLDPANAAHHVTLGRLYQYSIADLQPERSLEHFRRAAELNPEGPQAWIELAAALLFQGNAAEAEACLRRADSLAPNIPGYQWPIANFYLLQGNVDEAFRHFRVILAGTQEHDQIVFSTAWKASGEADKILDELIPRRLATEFSYLSYLLSQQRLTECQSVWKRLVSGTERFAPQRSARYIDALITARRPEEAYQVWKDLEKKGLITYAAKENDENLVTNGDFESDFANMGFDWRTTPIEGAYAGVDPSNFHSPSHSLTVQFWGKQNVDFHHVSQFVKVSPNRSYRLQAFMKTEDITTDSGPRLEVRDFYNSAALHQFTDDLTGRTNGWTSMSLEFKTGPKTELLVVGLARLPSRKLDNLIAGKAWLDDVRLDAVRQ